jgi:hypothetical protein
MKRTYLALAGAALAGAALPSGLLPPLARAAGVFRSEAVDTSRFAVLARPVGTEDWNLVILEQLQAAPACWQTRADGLVDPALNRFDHSGVCGRYVDSNGYSLRIGEQDLAGRYRLQLEQQGEELLLQAVAADPGQVVVIGRGRVPARERDAFVALSLDSGWELRRRAYGVRSLNHLYLSHGGELADLLAPRPAIALRPADAGLAQPPTAPPPLPATEEVSTAPAETAIPGVRGPLLAMGRGGSQRGMLGQRPRNPGASALERALQGVGSGSAGGGESPVEQRGGSTALEAAMAPVEASGGVVPLTVVPFRE